MRSLPTALAVLLSSAVVTLAPAPVTAQALDDVLATFQPRAVGPAKMGGRTVDFAVYEANPSIFYAASASGGLLKTVNGGISWENVFDDQATVSIGDVAINPNDPDIVWVGTGEANNRQSSSWGDGLYKSTDGGSTWTHMGLRDSHHIGRIVVHPIDTDIVYVAAVGHLWGPNMERGVFMTTDGGQTWEHVLAIDENTGVIDLALDPLNPKTLYAAAYARRRSGWGFNGGSETGGIFKSVDGGRSWRELSKGLPKGATGRIGLDIYRSDPNIVYAVIEAEDGGVFRSDDKGESWTRMSDLNPRPMYFSQIRVDPNDDDRIYLGGVQLHVSDDGGRTFSAEGAPGVHLDHHAFWIDPSDSRHLLDGNDGGTWQSRDKALTWEHLNNYPIGQFYDVAADMQEPYHIFGGMQDNATWGGPSGVRDRQGISNEDWYMVLACDGMYVAVDPSDEQAVYTNCQNGRIVRYDRRTGERQSVMPDLGPEEPALRWNWTTPIVVSAHDERTLYTGGNRLFRSTDRGHSWVVISPDLTRQIDRDTLPLMGVRGTDVTLSKHDGMTSFGNITALAESPLNGQLLYVGTDDGKVHVTRDGGATWTDLTDRVRGVPPMLYVSRLTPSRVAEGTVYLSFDGHRSDNFEAYVFVSTDYGQTWRSIVSNLDRGPVYVIAEDPRNPDLLHLGTEFGLYASLDRGAHWTRWPTFPTVAVYGLMVHPRDNDLILATHGRSFLIFDDISALQQMGSGTMAEAAHLFDPRPGRQFIPNENGWFLGGREYHAPNPEFGTALSYWLGTAQEDSVTLTISDRSGTAVRELKGPGTAGLHRLLWDLRAEPYGALGEGLAGALNLSELGPFVLPGEYQVALSVGAAQRTTTVRVNGDPQIRISDADRKQRYEMLVALTSMQKTAGQAADAVNALRTQVDELSSWVGKNEDAPEAVKTRTEEVTKQVAELRRRLLGGRPGGDDEDEENRLPPVRQRINGLKSQVIGAQALPTALQQETFAGIRPDLDAVVADINAAIERTLPELYRLLADNGIQGLPVKTIPPVGR
ncbi:MAG: hypothetical protein R3E10_06795 [Gemmatimonadota bacterium]